MPAFANELLLDRIAAALGVGRDDLERVVPESPPADWLVVDGAPDQFSVWADQVLDPAARRRLLKIAAIMKDRGDG